MRDEATRTLSGIGLHGGGPCSIEVARTHDDRALVFRTDIGEAGPDELRVRGARLGVRVDCPRIALDVESVEHLFAALGGLSIRRGLAIRVSGGEVPLADGCAVRFASLLESLAPPAHSPSLVVERRGEIVVGDARYLFEPHDATIVDVEVAFEAPAIGVQRARWDGTKDAFLRNIAPARTFGFRRDAAALARAGRARGVDPSAVMVLDDAGAVEPPSAPATDSEFARHKLLDLIGDTYLFGGPPRGKTTAWRPGHAATHRAVTEAMRRGLLVRCPESTLV